MDWNASIFFKSGEVLDWSASVILRELSTAKRVSTYSPLQQFPAIAHVRYVLLEITPKHQIKLSLQFLIQNKCMHFEQNLSRVSCSSVVGHLDYNGGQKCWDLSSDISKTSDPSPPTPNKVEFRARWVEMSAFLATTLLGKWGDDGMKPK